MGAPPFPRRRHDLMLGLGGACAGTAGIVLLFQEPTALLAFMLLLLAVLLAQWHNAGDLVALFLGVTLGNLTEGLCDLAGVWVHHTRALWNVAPAYIFVCYPILWLTVPRLMDAVLGRFRQPSEAAGKDAALALALWGAHTVGSFYLGTHNSAEAALCITVLAACLWRFDTAHDRAFAALGGLLGLLWELPATTSGAWTFPSPQILGLIPAWLPLAYAIFFVTLGRVLCFWRALWQRALIP